MMDDDPIGRFLSAIPGMPRPILDRLVDQMIDRMNVMDGDPDLEDSETGNHLVDERGNWIGGEMPPGPWHEDDEENGDLEGIDEREPDDCTAGEFSDPEARAYQRRRIQRDRCRPLHRWERIWTRTGSEVRPRLVGYRLKKEPAPMRRLPAPYRKRKRRR